MDTRQIVPAYSRKRRTLEHPIIRTARCPNCGEKAFVEKLDMYRSRLYRVVCPHCNMIGPTDIMRERALRKWNRIAKLCEIALKSHEQVEEVQRESNRTFSVRIEEDD